jgi:RNA polymerase sigma-70 factor (ECF subfamily)
MKANSLIDQPDAWFREKSKMLERLARSYFRDASLVEDLVQETFLSALRGRGAFRGEASEGTWLAGILRHKMIDELRRIRRHRTVNASSLTSGSRPLDGSGEPSASVSSSAASPDAVVLREELGREVRDALAELPPRTAAAFPMRALQGRSTQEACEALDVTRSNLRVLVHRAREHLRLRLRGPAIV